MKNLTIEQKIHQMFILGYTGENPKSCPHLINALNSGLGGVIFFTQNIVEKEQFKNALKVIKEKSLFNPLLSIDQEGGRVERTLNLYGGAHYLSAQESANKGVKTVQQQTQRISEELNYLGLNMNFAPVLDVNTNPKNPIIGNRSFSNDATEVTKFGKIAIETYLKNKIIPVGKHFPGHGDTTTDSHQEMPIVNLTIEELENIHIKPFKNLAKILPAIMIAHVHYTAFDKEKIPASISSNVVNYLRDILQFNGVIISDDMIMGGIKKYTALDACKQAINAGVNMFIYRTANESTTILIEELIKSVKKGEINEDKINKSVNYIQMLKNCC